MPRTDVRRAVSAGLSIGGIALFTGCILFVNNEALGEQCRFAGSDSSCGACVRERCQSAVDACCREQGCSETMTLLDNCASHHDATCTALAATSGALGRCVADRCAGQCQPLAGTSETACKDLELAPGAGCTCGTSTPPTDFVCNESIFAGTRCCAPKGWPGAGLECSCRRLSCNPTADGCFCTLSNQPSEQQQCAGQFCCVNLDRDDQCTCRSRKCFTNERAVPSCTLEFVGCGPQDPVASCSSRVP